MNNRSYLLSGMLLALVASFCATAQASVVIDPFDEVGTPDPWPISRDTVGAAPDVFETGLSSVLGGERLTRLTVEALDIERLDEIQVGVFDTPAILAYASSILADGMLDLIYGGGNGLNVNLSNESWIEIDLLAFDLASAQPMNVAVTLSDSNTSTQVTQLVTVPGHQTLVFPFVSFGKVGALDLTDIQEISVNFDSGFGADFRIGEIRSVVPEPATIGLLVSGAVFVLRRRRH